MASKLRRLVVASAAELDAQLAAYSGSSLFVLFSGAKDSSGVSWCGDCTEAEPFIDAALATASAERDVVLLYAPLARAEYKGNAGHWARVHPSFKLERVPTLFKMGKSRPTGSLVEGQCKDAGLLAELFE